MNKTSLNTNRGDNVDWRRKQLAIVIVIGVILLLAGIVIGLAWRDAALTTPADDDSRPETSVASQPNSEYEALIKESEDVWYEDMSRRQRNAHFWKYTGRTMDEYRQNPQPIKGINNQWEAFKILRAARSFKYSVAIGKTMFASDEIPDGVVKRQFYLSLSTAAKEAQDDDFYDKTFAAFKNAVMNDDTLPDSVKRSTIRLHSG